MAKLTLRNIVKTLDTGVDVVKGIDLQVMHGEFMVLVGPSGCGNSTVLRMIAGLEEATSGDILMDDVRLNDVPAARRGIAMVFQHCALYPHMTVEQNMGFPLKLAGGKSDKVATAVRRAAELLRIAHLLDRNPMALSGVQCLRVAIGRAIVRRPRVFLFDEPLSHLDASLRAQMQAELLQLHRELGTTMVYITHDQAQAMTLGHRVAVFNDGRIEQVAPPMELYACPANRFVAGFLGSPRMNLVPVTITQAGEGQTQLKLPDGGLLVLAGTATGVRPGDLATLGFRPDQAGLLQVRGYHNGGLNGRVELIERLGDATLVHVRCPGTALPLIVSLPGHAPAPHIGEYAALTPDMQRVCLFDRHGLAIASLPGPVLVIDNSSHAADCATPDSPVQMRSAM